MVFFTPFYFKDAGIWYIFHKVPTGESHALFPETKAELTPLGIFYNNKVHSNFKVNDQADRLQNYVWFTV